MIGIPRLSVLPSSTSPPRREVVYNQRETTLHAMSASSRLSAYLGRSAQVFRTNAAKSAFASRV